ncbi:uncharacterized protein Z518_07192 [Rhinocladiella mackenziei CBS 650.93]|uniref:DNA replication complex GINS protein SLD5 n=1 Tax=Rhinocladiella mackenziei CBS 650.93 TaxID=1442369 RepID=A0A0D2ICQ3_9EURO|nr:uncharacterized protein Z518_07192 [Rhinocladiella mackenziei CBS 650.93]KIX03639.1 hypothetical protein Z518_07192 [Rhinocladiella mackenziei CBS 650.93]
MDQDISDILASVSRPQDRLTSSLSADYDTDACTDHQLLTRAWTSERCAPDLLPYPSELMDRVITRVQQQISRIEDLASGIGDQYSTSATGAGTNGSGTTNANLVLSILQTDLSRTQFLVRSLLRQRLAKLTKHAVFYLSRTLESDIKTRYLSPAEVQFLRAHQALLSELYDASFLTAFPAALRRLDDSSGGVAMVEPPDGGQAVVVRCLSEGIWSNERDLDQSAARNEDVEGEGASVELRMRRGEIWVVRWRDVKPGVERGELELL